MDISHSKELPDDQSRAAWELSGSSPFNGGTAPAGPAAYDARIITGASFSGQSSITPESRPGDMMDVDPPTAAEDNNDSDSEVRISESDS